MNMLREKNDSTGRLQVRDPQHKKYSKKKLCTMKFLRKKQNPAH